MLKRQQLLATVFCALVIGMFIPGAATPAFAAKVTVAKSSDGWRLLVDGKPFFIRGVCFLANPVGEDANENTLRDWMVIDDDKDGRNDIAYQTWVDANRNNIQDPDEKPVGDFQLLKDMGANTIRVYHHSSDDPEILALDHGLLLISHAPNKALMRELYEKFGIRVMMGDLIGAYSVGSGAQWVDGTDYRDPVQRANMLKGVEDMVRTFKDEPYILLWALGNENNLTQFTQNNSAQFPEDYAKFVDEVARRIHELDPDHPVALVNGETAMLQTYDKFAPNVDIIALNSYRNGPGFSTLWKEVAAWFDRPVLLSEFGTGTPLVIDGELKEDHQAKVHKNSWLDIEAHAAGQTLPGNAIGGFAFEWVDNWWQNGNPWQKDLGKDGWHYEWNGLIGQGDGKHSPLMRQLRKAYFVYKDLWNG